MLVLITFRRESRCWEGVVHGFGFLQEFEQLPEANYDRHMAKAYKGMGMEGAVARWYAAITRKSLADFELLAERVAGELPLGSSVLDVYIKLS